ncbi:MAG TPA: hypothetical protein VK988_11500 [Acidimicrobiales bacterium]|nr:hypothetical protein [Acidimicrobiales bacterium]
MTLRPLYLEGLTQRALRGQDQLGVYKLGLIEAILKEALRSDQGQDVAALRSAVQDAVEVAQWEMRAPRGSGTKGLS